MYDVLELSNYVIGKFNDESSPITNLKLQKVLYYIQGYFFKQFKNPAFEDNIYCWTYGPVVPAVYYKYSIAGRRTLERENTSKLKLKAGEDKLINKIVQICIPLGSFDLVEQTHNEDPWMKTIKNNVITQDSISLFFTKEDPLNIWKN